MLKKRLLVILFSLLYERGEPVLCQTSSAHSSVTALERTISMPDTAGINNVIRAGNIIAQSNPDSAMLLFSKAIATSWQTGFTDGMATALNASGVLYYNKGAYDTAITVLEQAILFGKRTTRRKDALPVTYVNMGNAWSQKGDYEKASTYYDLALEAAGKHAGMEVLTARIYTNYAGMFGELNESQKALEYLEKGEQVLRKSNLIKPLAILLYNKAAALMNDDRYKEGAPVMQEALALSRQQKDIPAQKRGLSGMGAVYIHENQPEKALQYLEEAYQLRPATDPNIETGILLNLSEAYNQTGKKQAAIDVLLQLLVLADKHGMSTSRNTMEAHNLLSSLYSAMQNYEQAWRHQQRYVSIKDSLMSTDKVRNINQVEARYRNAQKERELTEKKLVIAQQQIRIGRNRAWAYTGVSGAVLLAVICLLLYRNIRHRKRLEKARLQVSRKEQQLKVLKATMNGKETERMRIGRELHDGVGGLLSVMKMNLSMLRTQHIDLEHSDIFRNTFSLMDETVDELRKTAHNLMPEMLLKGGLTEVVKNFCERVPHNFSLELKVLTYGKPIRLGDELELSLYRIIQELVNNIFKHSRASHALVQLGWQEDKLNITIEDNGIGFDVHKIKELPDSGIGLNNIMARVQALEGEMDIESAPGTGTTIELEFVFETIKVAAI